MGLSSGQLRSSAVFIAGYARVPRAHARRLLDSLEVEWVVMDRIGRLVRRGWAFNGNRLGVLEPPCYVAGVLVEGSVPGHPCSHLISR